MAHPATLTGQSFIESSMMVDSTLNENDTDVLCEIPAGKCDCYGREPDCLGICGGSACYDVCGVCNGPGFPDGACDC